MTDDDLRRRQAILQAHLQRDADDQLYQQYLVDRDHASAEQSRRDDLARDAARIWHGLHQNQRDIIGDIADDVAGALDRLTAVYLPDGPQELPR